MITSPRGQRLFDMAIALPLLAAAVPLCVALMVAIRIESAGSPLFVQQRVGRNQRPFAMLKLRTMRAGTPDLASHEISQARITPLGALLRRLKLDELPQLWNVLVGEMSLIGPRPCLPNQAELVAERSARGLFAIRPGVTGPAQLACVDMSEPRRLAEVEAEYFSRSRTIRNDVGLLARTFAGGGRGDAVTTEAARMRPEAPEGD